MDPLTYSVQALGYILGPGLREKKAALIADINTIQTAIGRRPVNSKQFDELYELDINTLVQIVNDQSSVLARINHLP